MGGFEYVQTENYSVSGIKDEYKNQLFSTINKKKYEP